MVIVFRILVGRVIYFYYVGERINFCVVCIYGNYSIGGIDWGGRLEDVIREVVGGKKKYRINIFYRVREGR